MGAVGNYEVITETVGPFIVASGTQTGTVPLPAGKVVLGVSVSLNEDRGEIYVHAVPSAAGTSVDWRYKTFSPTPTGAGPVYVTMHITCAEMGS